MPSSQFISSCAVFLLIAIFIFWFMFQKSEKMSINVPEFILYHNPGCPSCQVMMEEWNMLESAYSKKPINLKVYQVDVTKNPNFAEKKQTHINKTPTMILYPFGNHSAKREYVGPRTAKAMNDWIHETMNEIVKNNIKN